MLLLCSLYQAQRFSYIYRCAKTSKPLNDRPQCFTLLLIAPPKIPRTVIRAFADDSRFKTTKITFISAVCIFSSHLASQGDTESRVGKRPVEYVTIGHSRGSCVAIVARRYCHNSASLVAFLDVICYCHGCFGLQCPYRAAMLGLSCCLLRSYSFAKALCSLRSMLVHIALRKLYALFV
jgi:hypothetical protein